MTWQPFAETGFPFPFAMDFSALKRFSGPVSKVTMLTGGKERGTSRRGSEPYMRILRWGASGRPHFRAPQTLSALPSLPSSPEAFSAAQSGIYQRNPESIARCYC